MAKAKKSVRWSFVENVSVIAHATHKYTVKDSETGEINERSMDLVAIKDANGNITVPVAAEQADEGTGAFIMTLE